MIVTLAGHVDHGKTTLVRLLTGTDTDRLAEEKRRGLTIDLGFAYLNGATSPIGFVDVPGHHRFIHNMVAGVAATQHALLVVAADDGPMPQTREHLQILDLLGVNRGTIALTKCDAADPARIEAARAEIGALTAGSFLEGAEIVETSATTAEGIDELRAHLLAQADRTAAGDLARPFRMPIDRSFTLKGAGLVVTGTVHGGRVVVDDELFVFPLGSSGRIRELRVQDRPARSAGAGDRAAINLSGLSGQTLGRGHWLCRQPDPGHRTLVLDLQVLADFPRHVRHWTPVHVYHATSHARGRLALLESSRLAPGARQWAELVLDRPLLAKRGDRLVVRDQALECTLGGGTVIDNQPASGRRRAPARLARIGACSAPAAGLSLAALLEQGPARIEAFDALWNLLPNDLDELLGRVPAVTCDGWLVGRDRWQAWRSALLEECRLRHSEDPALQGLRENDFESHVPAPFRGRLLAELTGAGVLEQRAGRFRPESHRTELSDAEQTLLSRLAPLIDGTQPPSLGDLARALHIPLDRLKIGVKALAGKQALVQISDKRIYLPAHLAALAQAAEELSRRGPFTARDYRDAAGIGRNVAIDVLEYFDGRGFTRRQGESRTVVADRSKLPAGLG